LFNQEKPSKSIYDKIEQNHVTKITYQQDLHLLSPKIVKKKLSAITTGLGPNQRRNK